jgi:hypothetical protein
MSNVNITEFAQIVHTLLLSDRDVVIGVSGFTGEGKSTFTSHLAKEYAKIANTHWGFDRMTWQRKEMMTWIDGEGREKKGQLPEYSVIVPDELFTMFYRRQWYQEEQIDAIATFNMCRDRHLLVIGNVPNFWDLDGGFTHRIRFYIYIAKRGIAWVFEQENNPFVLDPWNLNDNRKMFRKNKNPKNCPNFICEIHFGDWSPKEKEEYYQIRNTKRVEAMNIGNESKSLRNKKVTHQRNLGIRWTYDLYYRTDEKLFKKVTQYMIAENFNMTTEAVEIIINPREKEVS